MGRVYSVRLHYIITTRAENLKRSYHMYARCDSTILVELPPSLTTILRITYLSHLTGAETGGCDGQKKNTPPEDVQECRSRAVIFNLLNFSSKTDCPKPQKDAPLNSCATETSCFSPKKFQRGGTVRCDPALVPPFEALQSAVAVESPEPA